MTDTRILVLIPARMAATRLPGKPLLDIGGLPMIVHVLHHRSARNVQQRLAGQPRGGHAGGNQHQGAGLGHRVRLGSK